MKSSTAPLIAFVGTTPNIGTTTAAYAAAYRIAEATGRSVGYLCLHLKSAKLHRFLGIDQPQSSLDKLRPELRSESLTADKLMRASYRPAHLPGLHVLFGNMARDQAEFFTPEEANHLLDIAEQAFSIVILDAGAYWDNAATVCSLRRASTRVVVTTPALSHFGEDGQRWIGQVSPLFGVASDQYEALIIHSPWRTGGFTMKDICKEMGTSLLGEQRLSPALFSQLDNGRYEEWLKSDEEGKQMMRQPAQLFMKRYGLGLQQGPRSVIQPWYRKLIAHRGGVGS
ncbi:hypothetical protein ACFO9Q_10040 [Paenibacillus sp. GCM10023252]|uniref:hypothetical protein n=1 Tax=Paenibacillus sp. GCM10023252 TaxID=3252649 RepID=UPI0036071B48